MVVFLHTQQVRDICGFVAFLSMDHYINAFNVDKKSAKGKLRVLYECFPMAFIMEQAGGKASTGSKRILDLVPTAIHDRSPIFLGSKEDVEDVEKVYQKHAAQ